MSAEPDPSSSVLDEFKGSVAHIVSGILGITFQLAYSGVDLGKKGVDFTVAVPRYRLPSKPLDLVAKIKNEVSFFERDTSLGLHRFLVSAHKVHRENRHRRCIRPLLRQHSITQPTSARSDRPIVTA